MSSVSDFLYGWLGRNKMGTPEYNISITRDGIFQCVGKVKERDIRCQVDGNVKKTVKENASKRLLKQLVEKDIIPKNDIPNSIQRLLTVSRELDENNNVNKSPTKSQFKESFRLNSEEKDNNALEKFHIFCQRNRLYFPKFEVTEDSKNHTFTVTLNLDIRQMNISKFFSSTGASIKSAKHKCASAAYNFIMNNGGDKLNNSNGKRVMAPSVSVQIDIMTTSRLFDYITKVGIQPPMVDGFSASHMDPISISNPLPIETDFKAYVKDSSSIEWSKPESNWHPWICSPLPEESDWYNLSMENLNQKVYWSSQKVNNKTYNIRQSTSKLPIFNHKNNIIRAVSENPVVLIEGGTGSGKSTQVVQYLLDDYIESGRGAEFTAYVTQPRRIAAISLAKRVATERGEQIGNSVGYNVRLDTYNPRPFGAITFCTIGVLLRKLVYGLKGISHIVIDEVHERNLETDFLLILVREISRCNPELRVILMSASLETTLFSEYFDKCPVIVVEGNTFNVETLYLEATLERFDLSRKYPLEEVIIQSGDTNYSVQQLSLLQLPYLIEDLISRITAGANKSSILVFLPSWSVIMQLKAQLENNASISCNYIILPLHSLLNKDDQQKIFLPNVKSKIILSTNIAESSVTINGCDIVIDSCRNKESVYEIKDNAMQYDIVWATRANLVQRRGRAGRLRPGMCFHLCSQQHFEIMESNVVPEILRRSLDDVILNIKNLNIGDAHSILEQAINPPLRSNIDLCERNLMKLGALDEDRKITMLGRILERLPVHAKLGKSIVLGAIIGVGSLSCELAAMMTVGIPFSSFDGEKNYKKTLSLERLSDHAALIYILQTYEDLHSKEKKLADDFCNLYDLKSSSLALAKRVKAQIINVLQSFGFPEECFSYMPITWGSCADALDVLNSVIVTALYPNVCFYKGQKKLLTIEGVTGILVNGSLTESASQVLMTYTEKTKSRVLFCKEATIITVLHLLMFGSELVECIGPNMIRIDSRFIFEFDVYLASCIYNLRPCINKLINKICEIKKTNGNLTDTELELIEIIKELSCAVA